jgi:hypothetical protein
MNDKVKVESAPAAMTLVDLEVSATAAPVEHVCAARPRPAIVGEWPTILADGSPAPPAPFFFVVHFQLPGNPGFSVTAYYLVRLPSTSGEAVGSENKVDAKPVAGAGAVDALDTEQLFAGDPKFDHLFRSLLLGDSEWNSGRIKFIPNVVEAPYIVRKVVGNAPAIIGRKLSQRYYYGPRYMEVDIDVGSSLTARKIMGSVLSNAKGMTFDMAFVLQGEDERQLPERILGSLRLFKADLSAAPLV